MTTIRSKAIIPIFLALVAGLLFAAAVQKSFWEDEAFVSRNVQNGYSYAIQAEIKHHPPLYPLIATTWSKAFGVYELGLRSLSVLLSLVTLGLTYVFAAQLYNQKTGLIAAALLGLSPLFITYGPNARYYALAAALSMGTALSVLNFQRSDRGVHRYAWLAGYIGCGIGLLYTVYTAFAVVAACTLFWFILWRISGRRREDLVLFGAATILIGLAFLPWLPNWRLAVGAQVSAITHRDWLIEAFKRIAYLGFIFSVGETLSPLNPFAWAAGLAVVGLGINQLTNRRARRENWAPLLFLVAIFALAVFTNIIAVYPQSLIQALPNRTFYALPFFMIWLAAGLASLQPRPRWALAAMLFIPYIAGLYNYYDGQQFIRPILAVPWREIMATVQAESSPDPIVVCNQADTTCPYYVERFQIELLSPAEISQRLASGVEDIWWIQTNLSEAYYDDTQEQTALAAIAAQSTTQAVYHYVPADASIQWIKTRLFGLSDNPYRVDVTHFVGSGR